VEPAPLLLGFILGPMMEENLRRALLLSRGDWSVFVTRPLSAGLLAAAALLLVIVLLPARSRTSARRRSSRIDAVGRLTQTAPAGAVLFDRRRCSISS
jgi:TctA family transporter